MSQCNCCSLRDIRKRAKETNKSVTRIPDSEYKLGGENVYIHPHGLKIKDMTKQEREKFFVAWFMEVTSTCCCDA